MPPESLCNLKPNMSGTQPYMLRLSDSEVDVSDFHPVFGEDPKVVVRHEIPLWLARHHRVKLQSHVPKCQITAMWR